MRVDKMASVTKNIGLLLILDQLSDDWVVSGCHSVENSVNPLQWLLSFHINSVPDLIINVEVANYAWSVCLGQFNGGL